MELLINDTKTKDYLMLAAALVLWLGVTQWLELKDSEPLPLHRVQAP